MKHYNFDEIIPREGTDCVKYDIRKEYFGTEDVTPMWVADMDFRTPDFILEAIRQRLNHEILGYSIRNKNFNHSIVNWMKKRHGWEIQKEWISFSPGVVPAVNMLVLALTKPGDKIIVQPPVYFPFFYAVENNGRVKVENPLKLVNGRLSMDFEDLKVKAPGAKMMIISHPHNPGGSVWTKNELLQMAEICLENDILMVSDEIHSDLIFKGFNHIPLASLSDEIAQKTITTNAPSKTFNLAGLSTSYLIIPDENLRKTYLKMLNDQLHLSMGNLFGSIALQAAYENGDEWLGQMLGYVRENVVFVDDFLKANIPQIKACLPESTYMIWLDCRELGLNGDDLKNFFIKDAKAGFNDGRAFGSGGEGFMRINVACPRAVVEKVLLRVQAAVDGR